MPNVTIDEIKKVCEHLTNIAPKHPMTVLNGSINIIENNEIPFGKFKETE